MLQGRLFHAFCKVNDGTSVKFSIRCATYEKQKRGDKWYKVGAEGCDRVAECNMEG